MWQAFPDGLSVFSEKWTLVLGVVIVACLGCCFGLFSSQTVSRKKAISRQSIFLLSVFFIFSVILRLAFVTGIFVPPYFDSVEHYRIIEELVTALGTSNLLETIPSLTPDYYHLGFHFLASLLAFGLRADPMDVILVLGQVMLAAIPIPLFFLIRGKTQSDAAAFWGMLLAGFGWYMPGFAVNWGKYPALAGLLALEIVLSMAGFLSRGKAHRNQIVLLAILFLGIIISTLFHTRTLIVIAISFASWLAAGRLRALPKTCQYFSLAILLGGILVTGALIQAEPLLNLALEPYLDTGLWITLTVVILSLFALIEFPRGVYSNLLFILCIFIALFIPIGSWLPGLESQTLLDRPFVEMVLYLPLSILGGLGLAGALQFLGNLKALPERAHLYTKSLTAVLLIGFTGAISLVRYDFYPSDCCNFVRYDDTVAFDWLDRNLPPDARILIASTQMNVLPSGPAEGSVGTDAGIWIPMLIGRNTAHAPFDIDFRSASTLEQLCQTQIDYIYIGGTEQTFSAAQLQAEANWYERVLFLPNAQLYRVIGCKK